MLRSGNPALKADTFTKFAEAERPARVMTISGTAHKTVFLLACCGGTAAFI